MCDNSCSMITRILIGFAISTLGFLMTWKTDFFLMALGSNAWAEEHLGGGGTRLFYKLLGTAIILLGFMVITNLFESFMGGIVRSLFG